MAKILVISSWVSCGHVGASAAQPVLQALGHEVIVIPTVILSSHYGFHGRVEVMPFDVGQLARTVTALMDNSFLDGLDAVLTGYMPSAAHVDAMVSYVPVLRQVSPGARVVVDPVMGDDDGGLYVPQDAAKALRDTLVPLADRITPNLYEWDWMGRPGKALVTSHGRNASETGVFDPGAGMLYPVPVRQGVPKGTGDAFSALVASNVPVGQAVGMLDALIGASLGAPHLAIAQSASVWTAATPVDGVAHGV